MCHYNLIKILFLTQRYKLNFENIVSNISNIGLDMSVLSTKLIGMGTLKKSPFK